MPKTPRPLADRLWSQVTVGAPDECWPWASTPRADGYGQLAAEGKPKRMLLAHRAAWLVTHGEIPDGMTLDHLCHTADPTCPGGVADPHRRCCNPAHLEPVSLAENKRRGLSGAARNARKETCKYGHRNWKVRANGSRRCVDCHRRDSINQSRRSRG